MLFFGFYEGSVQRINDVEGITKLEVYPNLATSWVTVDMEGLSGKEVMNANTDANKVSQNVETLTRGTYFVGINDERAATIRKLIVRCFHLFAKRTLGGFSDLGNPHFY